MSMCRWKHDFKGSVPMLNQTHCAVASVGGREGLLREQLPRQQRANLVCAAQISLSRPSDPRPITRWELMTDRCERPINHREQCKPQSSGCERHLSITIPQDKDHRFNIDQCNWVVEAFSQLSCNSHDKNLMEMDYAAVGMSKRGLVL